MKFYGGGVISRIDLRNVNILEASRETHKLATNFKIIFNASHKRDKNINLYLYLNRNSCNFLI